MKKVLRILPGAGFCGVILCAAAMAQEGGPQVKTNLPADTMPTSVGLHIMAPTKKDPRRYGYNVGVARVRATIAKDGTLKNLRLERLAGNQGFADTVLDKIKDWRYKPATHNGQPVDYPNYPIQAISMFSAPERGAQAQFKKILLRGINQANAGKYEESIATLLPMQSKSWLHLSERSILALQLGIDFLKTHDDLTAREYLDQAVLIGNRSLPERARPVLWHMAMVAHTNTRRFSDVRDDYKNLKALVAVAPGTRYAKLAAEAEKEITGTDKVVAPGRIDTVSPLAAWQYHLIRHTFSIQNVSGDLGHIELACHLADSHAMPGISSAFGDKAEWHIPKKWQDCALTVYGERGATFDLVQSAGAVPVPPGQ